jgi:hypothetical protein
VFFAMVGLIVCVCRQTDLALESFWAWRRVPGVRQLHVLIVALVCDDLVDCITYFKVLENGTKAGKRG